jgi:glycosyltransferase involved in cell wall biosynthesis
MLKDNITIVIPCKNESNNIYDCLGFIARQDGIVGTKVIIADSSDTTESLDWLKRAQTTYKEFISIEVVEGGYPAKARLNGSKLVKTPYVLFLDADIIINNRNLLEDISDVYLNSYTWDLITVPFQTEEEWNWVFRVFDIFQKLSVFLGTPFAVGGFQLFSTKTYWEIGGYNSEEVFAEDYSLSSKINPKKFIIHKTKGVWTSARRFKNKGVLWMFQIMVKSYINRNNPKFFKHHHNYWN